MTVSKKKFCKLCLTEKEITDFYFYKTYARSECKSCSKKKNAIYQKKREGWRSKFATVEEKRAYMRQYYADNKEKYREYRETFSSKHPNYLRERAIRKKEKERL